MDRFKLRLIDLACLGEPICNLAQETGILLKRDEPDLMRFFEETLGPLLCLQNRVHTFSIWMRETCVRLCQVVATPRLHG